VTELALTRSADDRRRYELAGLGSLRRPRLLSRDAEVTTRDGVVRTTHLSPTGKYAQITDAHGGQVGEYARTRWTDHSGTVTWRGLPYDLTVESHWRNRYLLSHHGSDVVRVACRGWGKKPATLELLDPRVDPGLVLFTTWLVQTFVEMNSSAAT
jgi:hypothetical protein